MSTRNTGNTRTTRSGSAPDPAGPDLTATDPTAFDLTAFTLSASDLSGAAWRKSSHSNGATNCVEVARLSDGSVGVRHSRRPDGAVIVYSRSEWAAFLAGVKAEEFEVDSA
ncbi:hypothetical protein GCM10009839_88370 [Catenulispora yoronensis]|uniref:DUF397 domain-containing protein n=1 Tax=Catenulispora yoronensis TaxID=450799 RepID=A0ABN2VJD9_9ACTN